MAIKLGQVNTSLNELGYDAWGRGKAVTDFSLFSALWNFDVPNREWVEYLDTAGTYVEQARISNIKVKSTGGMLYVLGDATTNTMLLSKRHPRYQPNRGFLYSTAVVLETPNVVGKRRWGCAIDSESGLFFELVGSGASYVLNAVSRTDVAGVVTENRVDITASLPAGFDISKGNIYDIQMQWRGVGNIKFFINLELIHTFEFLGTLSGLSINNPAMQVMYEALDSAGENLVIKAGCVDVTSEGGIRPYRQYTSEGTGETLLPVDNSTNGIAILAVKIPETITYDGVSVKYTRDAILSQLTTFCRDQAQVTAYYGRLVATPNLDAAVGWVKASDSFYEYLTNATGTLDTAFNLDIANMFRFFTTRIAVDTPYSHRFSNLDNADIFLAAGDIIVLAMRSDGASSTGGCTIEFSEEV